jgi:hypothetical protein
MSEPDFSLLSLPEFLLAEIDERIEVLRSELQHHNADAMIEPLRRLTRIRGNFAFDLISSIAWAAQTVCGTAASDHRRLNSVEMRSLQHAIDSMDRARRTAMLAVAV